MAFPVPMQSKQDRFLRSAAFMNQGLAGLAQGMGQFARGVGPETAEEKYRREEAERRKADEARRTADEARRVEQDALRKQLGGLMADEANIPGMTPAPPIPGTAGIPMDAMVNPPMREAPPPFTWPVGGGALNIPMPPEEPAPPLTVPQPQGVMQTAPVPVPGMGPDPRIDNWKKQKGILGQLGQYGEARTLGDRIEGLQVDDPPGLVRSEMSMIRPDMSKDDLRELLKSVKTMAVRGMITNRIEKKIADEAKESEGKQKYDRDMEMEKYRQGETTKRAEMGEKGATERTRMTGETRLTVAGEKPSPKAPISLDSYIENEKRELDRAVSDAYAVYKDTINIDNDFSDEEKADARKAWGDARTARAGFRIPEATKRWQTEYGSGAPAPKGGGDEAAFQNAYRAIVAKRAAMGQPLNPNPDDPSHKYDYRAAFKAGKLNIDAAGHFSSEFKADDHPNLIVDGVNTKTGQPTTAPTPGATGMSDADLKNKIAMKILGIDNTKSSGIITPPAPEPKAPPRKALGMDLDTNPQPQWKDNRTEQEVQADVEKAIAAYKAGQVSGGYEDPKGLEEAVRRAIERPLAREAWERKQALEQGRQAGEAAKSGQADIAAASEAKKRTDAANEAARWIEKVRGGR